MNTVEIILFLTFMLSSRVRAESIGIARYPPQWSSKETREVDAPHLLGSCAEEDERCGPTDVYGGMGGRMIFCCAGLWCSPDPAHSKEIYTTVIEGTSKASGDAETCSFYEYPYQRFFCKPDGYYPPLPVDFVHDARYDKEKPTFPDEN